MYSLYSFAIVFICEPHSSVSKSIVPAIIYYHRIFYIHCLSLLARSINRRINAIIVINSAI
ncbi:hypothetical protein [Listeria seeligeri]|uniref:hypothetical protein n=1 Tax=Listeria seeligeri TaxID=1640 RepID=UPI0016232129|nr:hypothetical protein [Listeria seeligeri]